MPLEISAEVKGARRTQRELERAGPEAKRKAVGIVKSTSVALERRIKTEMPVLHGRARASWGHWEPGLLVNAQKANASRTDAHWRVMDDGLTIEQGSNVEYIPALNDGHSKQAPAGFIDKAVMVAQRTLIKAVNEMLKRLF